MKITAGRIMSANRELLADLGRYGHFISFHAAKTAGRMSERERGITSLEDLKQEGYLVLMESWYRFQEGKGTTFATFFTGVLIRRYQKVLRNMRRGKRNSAKEVPLIMAGDPEVEEGFAAIPEPAAECINIRRFEIRNQLAAISTGSSPQARIARSVLTISGQRKRINQDERSAVKRGAHICRGDWDAGIRELKGAFDPYR